MTLHNNGNSPLHVSHIYLHPTIALNYDNPNWSGIIPAGGSQDIEITFRPTAQPYYSGAIYICV